MAEQNIICTVCPMGCRMHVAEGPGGVLSVEGYTCPRGEQYARAEFMNPVRILTTTVRVKNAEGPLLAARTEKPVPKEKLSECMEIIRKAVFEAPVRTHQVLIENLAGTGVDLIACTDCADGRNPAVSLIEPCES